jgi:rhodanese-related sulfurtransferase
VKLPRCRFHLDLLWLRVLLLLLLPALPGGWLLARAGWVPPDVRTGAGLVETALRERYPQILWIDARERPGRAEGGVPGALPLHVKRWEAELPAVLERWDGESALVVFCDPGCSNSQKVARKLQEIGLGPVEILER